ncbi:hypothetical protein AALP_AA4G171500 [Arabis alpina]|uniref:TIR domain-containing protein n=1 Tax=Arabis alpina TaxID=50452 RepID=A0A087H3U0_ARAAL|nr:hypothetical protein AALP_AA4G171500 [Arabis alpina]
MASSSSSLCTCKYDVFPSFSGEDVRKSFLSHFLKTLQRKLIITFIDNNMERSRPIAPELLLAIRESRISIVVFSKKYASSTWCLNELAEIHKCFKEMNQMVIPVFYELDPSHVRKQTGEFGKAFEKTCKDKTEDEKQRWTRALAEFASIAGYDSRKWSDDLKMIEQISSDVSNKLFTSSDDFRDFVGIDSHVDAIMDSKLCLESEGVRMVGILGPSGIGKSTIARALYTRLSTQFHHRAFVTSKRAAMQDKKVDYSMKLAWAQQLLSEILGQKNLEIESLGMVEQRLKQWKVLIVLDDVDDIELLKTLVGRTGWFGSGSRIIVVTQDSDILKSHEIKLIHEVGFPSENLALQMFCQSAFGQTFPPDGFMELAVEYTKLANYLPSSINFLGSSLRNMDKEYWVKCKCVSPSPLAPHQVDDFIGDVLFEFEGFFEEIGDLVDTCPLFDFF